MYRQRCKVVVKVVHISGTHSMLDAVNHGAPCVRANLISWNFQDKYRQLMPFLDSRAREKYREKKVEKVRKKIWENNEERAS